MTSVAIIGGLGHVGLPLGLFLAERGHEVLLQDVAGPATAKKFEALNAGRMPFIEDGADELVLKHWGKRVFAGYSGANAADVIIVCIGTPLDEYQNPRLEPVLDLAKKELAGLRPEQLVILRSTVFPGTTTRVAEAIGHAVAFAPERIVEGRAIRELAELPQIVSGTTEETARAAEHFFRGLGVRTVLVGTHEAELAKLCTNFVRYSSFAVANALQQLCTDLGADYGAIYRAMTEDYPRGKLPIPGLASGYCLRKDTAQLVAAAPRGFMLGIAAIEANERSAEWWVNRLPIKAGVTVAVMGAAFKPECDDVRDSLSFRVKKLLEFKGATVLMSDPYVPGLTPRAEALARADYVFIATPHAEYRDIPNGPNVVRIWEAR